jgi:general secretion pathway protein G
MEFHTVNGRRVRGFTLLELLVVMAIIATLLTIAVPRYFKSLDRSKETVLRQDLATMREQIDRYSGDKGHYPESLQALVADHYLRALPVDPFTGDSEHWQPIASDEPENPGIKDVKSGAEGNGQNGVPYAEW